MRSVALLLVLAPLGACGPSNSPSQQLALFTPFCEPSGFGSTVKARGFFLAMLKDPTGGMRRVLPNAAPGYVEPTCDQVKSNATPDAPEYKEPLYTWTGQPMTVQDGSSFTLGRFASHAGTFTYHTTSDGDFVVEQLEMSGGVAAGVYTAWFIDIAQAIDMQELAAQVVYPIGKPDGSDNVFIADATGHAMLTNRRIVGGAKLGGPKGVGFTYHLDGKTYGPQRSAAAPTVNADDPSQNFGITVTDVLWGEVGSTG